MSEDCPGRACFELLGRKWTAQIVWSLLAGPRRFSELPEAIPGLSDKILSHRLVELAEAGIVQRTQYPEIPPRVEYELTPAGLGLQQVIIEMERWSERFGPRVARKSLRAAGPS